MTSNQGGGTHPGDPWSPDWVPATPETPEDEWPYDDDSLTLSTAEIEIAGLDDDDEETADAPVEDVEPASETGEGAAAASEEDSTPDLDASGSGEDEADLAAAASIEAVLAGLAPAPDVAKDEVADLETPAGGETGIDLVELDEPGAGATAASDALELIETVDAAEPLDATTEEASEPTSAEPAERELVAEAEVEAPEVTEAAEVEPGEPEEPEAEEPGEVAAVEPEEPEAEEPGEVAEVESEAEPEVVEAEEPGEVAAVEPEEPELVVAEEPELVVAEEPEVVEAGADAVEAAGGDVAEVESEAEPEVVEAEEPEVAAVEPEEPEAEEPGEVAELESAEIEPIDEERAEPEAADAGKEAHEQIAADSAAGSEESETEAVQPALQAVGDTRAPEGTVDAIPMEEFGVEDLQGEPEWLEAVEEMTLDDIAEVGEQEPSAELEEPPALASVDGPAVPPVVDEVETEMVIEDATFEVVDLEDAELRADTAEHFLDALDFKGDEVAHDAATAEVPVAVESGQDEPAGAVEEDFAFTVPDEYEQVAADVDAMSSSLAAYMGALPPPADAVDALDEALGDVPAGIVIESDERAAGSETDESADPDEPAESDEIAADDDEAGHESFAGAAPAGQLQIPTEPPPSSAQDEGPSEPEPLTAEQELIASLTGDLQVPDFETFVEDDFSRDFAPEPTQEHRGLAEAISDAPPAEPAELSALAATMPGVDHGHVGFSEFEDELHFEDPDAPPADAVAEDDAEPLPEVARGGSDLTLRVASAIVLVALLTGTLWAGGVTFLIFISVIAIAAQIEFYTALRQGGYRPMVLFGLLGGLGALIGTYAQGSDVLTDGPIAIPAALGLTVVATFAWYGSQETPPREPWRNGLTTVLGVAWIPATLALVFPMAEVPRSERLQIIIVLLIAVAAFDIGSYFVGRALGSRKLSPMLSPNKTVEGLIGGVVATILVAVIAGAAVDVFSFGNALAVSAAIILAAPLGDLAESLIKRSLGIKDMGQLVPGHGGVLDRIDSYLFAVPIAYLMLRWTGLL